MREVRIPAFAKINLRLDILGKRPDGYHELRTIFQTISLHDELWLRSSRKPGISLAIHGNERLSREPVAKNLVYRAVDALKRELKIRGGVEIELHKKIPAGGGLGGGSSDAAAALLGYLRLTAEKARVAAVDRDRGFPGRRRAVFLIWREGAGSKPGGRSLSPCRHRETIHSRDYPAGHPRVDARRVSLGEGAFAGGDAVAAIDKIGR